MKNMDPLNDNVTTLLNMSSDKFVSELWKDGELRDGGPDERGPFCSMWDFYFSCLSSSSCLAFHCVFFLSFLFFLVFFTVRFVCVDLCLDPLKLSLVSSHFILCATPSFSVSSCLVWLGLRGKELSESLFLSAFSYPTFRLR